MKDTELQEKNTQLEEQQDYISILKDISVSDNQRSCTEVIYIATCDSYAESRVKDLIGRFVDKKGKQIASNLLSRHIWVNPELLNKLQYR